MFITKKGMEQKIAEAIEKERERQWQMDRIDHIERNMYRETEMLNMRISNLERLANVTQVSCTENERVPRPNIG